MKNLIVAGIVTSTFAAASCAQGDAPLSPDGVTSVEAPEPLSEGPRYENGGNLIRPDEYLAWPFLGSGVDLTYSEDTRSGPPVFTNVFVNPSAHSAFIETGTWPDGSIFVLEARASETDAEPNTDGLFQGALLGIEAEVKDSRFPDGWAFFEFGSASDPVDVAPPLSGEAVAPCVQCHTEHTAVERTFVQFYPTLMEVAREKGTVKPGF